MARKTATVTIDTEGRDKGKVFILTEASIYTQEDFAARVIMAALNGGATIPANVAAMGIPGLMAMGAQGLALIPYDKMKPLLDEMMQCVEYQPDPNNSSYKRHINPMLDGEIEEVGTLLQLRKAIVGLHTDFFMDAKPLTSGTPPQPAAVITSPTPT